MSSQCIHWPHQPGALINPSTQSLGSPLRYTCVITIVSWLCFRVTAISCGTWHGMVVTVGGSVLAFGRNHKGQLGLGDTTDRWRPTPVELSWNGKDSTFFRAAQVACGAAHSMVLAAYRGRLTACATGERPLPAGALRCSSAFNMPLQRMLLPSTSTSSLPEGCLSVLLCRRQLFWAVRLRQQGGQVGVRCCGRETSGVLSESFVSGVH